MSTHLQRKSIPDRQKILCALNWHLKPLERSLYFSIALLLASVFLAPAVSIAQTITIGTGTTANGTTTAAPINQYYRSMHFRSIYTVAEINAAGFTGPGYITQTGLYITGVVTYALPNFSIKMANVSLANLSTDYTGALTQVYIDPSYTPTEMTANAWNPLTLSTPFYWDGTSNIVIDWCFDQVQPTYSSTGLVRIFTPSPSAGSSRFVRLDAASQCAEPTSSTQTTKPQLQLTFVAATTCSGTPAAGTATASASTICAGHDFQLSVTGVPVATGVSVQWQSSATGAAGSYSDIPGATALTHITEQVTTTYYRAKVSCNGTNDAFSNVVTVTSPVLFAGGTYTINAAAAASSTNFTSFTTAVNAVSCGIAGPVTFNVVAGSGPYNEQVVIPEIYGTGATSRIIFNGNGNTVNYAATVSENRATVLLNGADFVTLDNLVINASTGTYGFGVQLINSANNNTISNSTIISDQAATSSNYAGIVASGSLSSATSEGVNASNTLITGNTITGGYYGITLLGAGNDVGANNLVTENTIQDFYYYGIYLSNQQGSVISKNDINRLTRTVTSNFYAVYLSGASIGNLIEKNEIHDANTGNPANSSTISGVYITGADATAAAPNRVENNLLYNFNGTGTIYALYNSGSDYAQYYHNTVSLDESASASTSVTYGLYQVTTANGLELKNNIISVTRGGTGNRRALHFNSTGSSASTFTINNNVLYVSTAGGTNDIAYVNPTTYNTVAAFEAASLGTGNLEVNPAFTSATNYTPTNPAADNTGAPLGVTEDIAGLARDGSTPDAGAIEFEINACTGTPVTGTVSSAVTNICPGSAFILDVTGTTVGVGIVIQWQRSADGVTFTDIAGETGAAFNGTQAATSYYRVKVTCFAGAPQYSNAVLITSPLLISGTFTINPALPAGSGNFLTIADAINSLECGINGPVIFNAAANAVFEEQVLISEITGASATNTVTFNGNGATINHTATSTGATRATVRLTGADYITINDFVINANDATYGWGVHLTGDANYNKITNNTVNIASNSTSSANFNGIIASNSLTTASSSGVNASNTLISGNTVNGGYYGILMVGNSTTATALNNHIIGNTVSDFYTYGIALESQEDALVSKNDISRPARTSVTTFYGISLGASSTKDVLIEKNRIHDTFNGDVTSTSGQYGIYISGIDAPTGEENRIENNLLYNFNGRGIIYALYNSGSDNVRYYHNTVSLDETASTATTATYGFYQTTTATGLQLINNIISITRGGTGNRRALHFNSTGASATTFTANHNVLYINSTGTNLVAYVNPASYATVADFENAGLGTGNVEADPDFLGAANFTPSNAAVDNVGTSVGVMEDIMDDSRDPSTPDAGAIEFFVPVCSAPVGGTATASASTLCGSGNATLTNTGFSFGTGTVYAWQSSADNFATAPVTTGQSDPSTFSTGTITSTMYYRLRVECTVSGQVDYSNVITITVNPNPVVAVTPAGGSVCPGATTPVGLTASGAVSYAWSPAAGLSATTGASVNALPGFTTTYTVTGTDANGCTSVATATVVVNPSPNITATTTASTICSGGTAQLGVNVNCGSGIKFTEITLYGNGGTGQTPAYPAYMGSPDDLVEISNLGTAPYNVGGMVFELWVGTTLNKAYTIPAGTIIPSNAALVIAIRAGTDSPADLFFNAGTGATNQTSGNSAGYVLKNGADVIDAVAVNTYTWPAGSGVSASDWSGTGAPSPSGIAGAIRTGASDTNTGSDWTASSATLLQSAGTYNGGYNSIDNVCSGYTYAWSPSTGLSSATVANPTITGLTSTTTYTVTTTTVNGCSSTSGVTVNVNNLAVSATQNNVSCNGGTNGTATVTATGGVAPYTYAWTGNSSTTATATGLAAGNYTVTVTDNTGCTTMAAVSITQPSVITSTGTQTNVSCNGAATGMATVTVTGGTAPYTYMWTGSSSTSATATGLAAGNYTVTITDANGCTATRAFTIMQPATAISAAITAQTAVSCFGGSNGAATVTATGGTATYTYAWSPSGGTAATATGLTAGTYTVTVTDANGCTDTETVTIGGPAAALVASVASATNVSCNGGSNGSATAMATGGTSGYTFSWSNGANTATASGLTAGTYTVTVTDANGCTDTESVTITAPAALVASVSASTNVSCNNGSNGSATASAAGGTGSVTYSWSNGANTATVTGLAAGTYTVTVTDANGCTDTESVTITAPAAVVASIASSVNVSCNGSANGSATVSATGGTTGYTYSWSNGATSATATGLAAGIYTVTVTDANGCTDTESVTITQPAAVTVSASANQAICSGSSATITASGATSYVWMPGGMTGASVSVSPTSTTIYTVTGTTNGCSATATTTIAVNTAPVVTASSNSPVNFNGTIMLSATGGGTYSWTGPANFSSNSQNPQISNATSANAGTYSVMVTNAGCSSMATTTVSVGSVLYLTIDQTQPATATNFTSIAAASAYLNTTGVSSPTVIDVIANTNVYTDQLILNQIPGASATNTVIINGNNNVINHCSTNPANRDMIRLNGTDYVTVNGFVLNATCSQGWGVHVMGDVENVTISNNTVHLSPQYSVYVGNMAGIIVGNSFTDPAAMAGSVTGLTISGNTINSGYHGIRINGNSTNVASNVNINNNILNAPKVFGLFMSYGDNVSVNQNQVLMFNAPAGTVLSSMGIYLVSLENLASVQRNKITNAGHMGMWLNYVNRTSTARGIVANNMIGGGFRNSTTYGVQLNSASNLDLYYNSINVDFGATGVGLYVSNLLSRELTLVNNSIAYTGSGANGRALHAGDAFENFTAIDYNNYYSTGNYFVYFNRGFRANLVALQASVNNGFVHDMNSWQLDPMYTGNTNLELQATSQLVNKALPLANVLVDYSGSTRTTTPTIGADEIVTGSPRLAQQLEVNVYPNPFRDELKVDVTGMNGAVELTLVDMMGRQVYSRTFDASAGVLTLQPQVQLAQGVYLLQISNNGSVTQTRVVKQ